MNVRKVSIIVTAIAVLSMGAAGQSKKSKPKPLATPLPVLTGAEIIGQAGDYVEPQPTPDQPVTPVRQTGTNLARIRDLNERVSKLESQNGARYDENQKRLLLNLDILTRAEQRSESLRKQVFEMIEKENNLRTRLDQIDYDIRPEVIERTTVQMSGSLRPEEIRESRRKSLDAERRNLQSLLTQIQNTHASLDAALMRAEQLVDRLRDKLEKDIDDALLKTEEKPEQ